MKQQHRMFIVIAFILGCVLGALFYSEFVLERASPLIRTPATDILLEPQQFASYDELVSFLRVRTTTPLYISAGSGAALFNTAVDDGGFDRAIALSSEAAPSKGEESSSYYSGTNVQVAGVDEPDIVKTDGTYIYTVTKNHVAITAVDPELSVASVIAFSDADVGDVSDSKIATDARILPYPEYPRNHVQVRDLFVYESNLVVFLESSIYTPYSPARCLGQEYCGGTSESYLELRVYSLVDPTEPTLVHTLRADGSYADARMIDDRIYLVTNTYVDSVYPELPVYRLDGVMHPVSLDSMYYLGDVDSSYQFTSVAAFSLESGEFLSESYLVGATGTVYASQDNLYLTSTKYRDYYDFQLMLVSDAITPLVPLTVAQAIDSILIDESLDEYVKLDRIGMVVADYYDTLSSSEQKSFDEKLLEAIDAYKIAHAEEATTTIVHKIELDSLAVSHVASGFVPGRLHNQFSMDEHNGFLRLATTTEGIWSRGVAVNSSNHVYVLDSDLAVVGSVTKLAAGEEIYSARFMEDRLYLVTYRQIDPLFVIDLSDPTAPTVLGYLKVTGVSDYLHMYDETHLLGIGREGDVDGRILGLKVSLFDVSDVSNPEEVATLLIGKEGSYSDALYNHHAILFDPARNLLVLPVTETTDSYEGYQSVAYVLSVTPSAISTQGVIMHEIPNIADPWYAGTQIERSLYIHDILYTTSQEMIMAHDLDTLDEVDQVRFNIKDSNVYYPLYYAEDVATARGAVLVDTPAVAAASLDSFNP